MDHIPRRNELTPVASNKHGRPDIMPFIDTVIGRDDFLKDAEKYKLDGGVTGEKKSDDAFFTDLVLEFDDQLGGNIRKAMVFPQDTDEKKLNGYLFKEIKEKVNVVLRRYYVLDKNGKIIGVNPKRFKQLKNSKTA